MKYGGIDGAGVDVGLVLVLVVWSLGGGGVVVGVGTVLALVL